MSVSKIGNYIIHTIFLDLAKTKGSRAQYARVCVKVDLSKPLLGHYSLDNKTFNVEYESLEDLCFGCLLYVHREGMCPAMQWLIKNPYQKAPLIPHKTLQIRKLN
ncbi:hypothetical protein LINPERPRIM_LOCUS20601 [Linum perenne]